VINQDGKAPAFLAANKGYDVWLGNNRGNKYSLMHKTLDPIYDKEFWENSFTDFGKYDVPGFINHIKEQSGIDKVSIIAHSQGTNQIFYSMANDPLYFKQNVNLFVALAPSARISKLP
jgi:lysosomal acid lipase/cholesteryl ester hydrolase